MTPPLASAGTPALWYLSRGSGAVSLILLSASVVLGIVDQRRWYDARWPRFALHTMHRWVSLFAVSFLSVHILSAVLDSFAPIRLVDAVVPFVGSYRPFWLGLGALAFDILLAVAITSLLKKRISHRAWRGVHWFSYAAWPIAVVHGLGTGSDVRGGWLLAVTAACVAAVWLAVFVRVSSLVPKERFLGYSTLAAVPLAAVLWLPHGPLAKGWARRAGTPARLLLASNVTHARPSAQDSFAVPFSAYINGSLNQSGGTTFSTVDIALRFSGGSNGRAHILLEGEPLAGGGVSVQQSRVTLGPASDPTRYSGHVVALDGARIVADATDQAGNTVRADFRLALEQNAVQGSVSVVRG